MDSYHLLKMLHVLAAVVITGTGAGIAFFMLMAHRSSNIAAIAITSRHVVLADWIFTTPAVAIQFVTGILLMQRLGYSFSSAWFLLVISLFIFIGLCWIPVVLIQYKLKALANLALDTGRLQPSFHHLMRIWTCLGIPAFLSVLVIFWLMIFKPYPVI